MDAHDQQDQLAQQVLQAQQVQQVQQVQQEQQVLQEQQAQQEAIAYLPDNSDSFVYTSEFHTPQARMMSVSCLR